MKIARRLLSLLLALLMVFAFVACGEDPNPATDDVQKPQSSDKDPSSSGTFVDPEVDNDFTPPERPVGDMTDKIYTIIQHSEIENPFGYSQDSQMGVMVADRVAEVQSLYGCTIEFSHIAYNDQFASQLQALTFSEGGGDMVFAEKNAMLRRALGTGGSESLMTDLLTVDHIINFWDMNKWGNISAREAMMAGGYFYGVTPALWVDCTPLPYYQVVYNKDLLATAELPDLQEYWEKEEWDRDTMLDVICSFDPAVDTAWGLNAALSHMTRATFLTTGVDLVIIDKINSDKTVEWSRGLDTADVADALQWLKNALKNHGKHFNNGDVEFNTAWQSHVPFNEGACAMAMTRPQDIFAFVVTEGPENFGLITWAGYEPNVISGFLEQVFAVSIPTFAQNAEHSAFLMYDLFEGLDDIESYSDVIAYYRETYFATDIDMECLVRENVKLQYSYWPNGVDAVWTNISTNLLTTSSIPSLLAKHSGVVDTEIEEHMVPNTVALEAYRQNGFFK